MTHPLIPVFNGSISSESTLLVNARDLHDFLGVRRDFSTWIKNRIIEYVFLIDIDFIIVENLTSPNLGASKSRARKVKDYHLTLDTAKELAMVERNEKGRQIRRYFIECEKSLTQKATQQEEVSVHTRQPRTGYLITFTYQNLETGFTETLKGLAGSVEEIITGTASQFGYHIESMHSIPTSVRLTWR